MRTTEHAACEIDHGQLNIVLYVNLTINSVQTNSTYICRVREEMDRGKWKEGRSFDDEDIIQKFINHKYKKLIWA